MGFTFLCFHAEFLSLFEFSFFPMQVVPGFNGDRSSVPVTEILRAFPLDVTDIQKQPSKWKRRRCGGVTDVVDVQSSQNDVATRWTAERQLKRLRMAPIVENELSASRPLQYDGNSFYYEPSRPVLFTPAAIQDLTPTSHIREQSTEESDGDRLMADWSAIQGLLDNQ